MPTLSLTEKDKRTRKATTQLISAVEGLGREPHTAMMRFDTVAIASPMINGGRRPTLSQTARQQAQPTAPITRAMML